MTNKTETPPRSFTSQLVAWCPDCQWWLVEDEIGAMCSSGDCQRKLVKRRMLICGVIACEMAFKTMEEAEAHDCYSVY